MSEADTELNVGALIEELDTWVRDGKAEVYVDDVPWGKQARIDFDEGDDLTVSRKEHEMKGAILKAYNDLLVAVHDIEERNADADSTLATVDDLWELAEAVTAFKTENDIDDFGDEKVYARLERVTEFADADRDEFEWAEAVAEMFDSRAELPDWPDPTRVGRLAARAESRTAADAVMELMDDGPTKRDVRLWKEFQGVSDAPNVADVADEARRRFKAKYGYTEKTWVNKVQTVYRLLGFDAPDEDAIRATFE